MSTTIPKVRLSLVGLEGNAYSVMGAFAHAAKRQGWKREQIEAVIADATAGDYAHLLATIGAACEDGDEDEEDNT